ncbi:hypothetical protein JI752_018620 [Lysobacter sp. MMG2]|uniref:hypothetical protein n=1 Tax=Lysobacter sp. MMG2 TaxID=2801338 RepID=UPI001C244D27|nr:hypothetical protein [Lysobacter sp. MMG2]MBU8978166.1 hypothetical protein [Lysobacter sp. MMG2]
MSADVLQFPGRPPQMPQPFPQVSAEDEWEQIEALNKELQGLLHKLKSWGRNEQRAINFLRYHFSVSSHTELTIGQMKNAVPMIRDTLEQCRDFNARVREMEKAFDEQVVGRGALWTPWIARKAGKRRMGQMGANVDWGALANELEEGLNRNR